VLTVIVALAAAVGCQSGPHQVSPSGTAGLPVGSSTQSLTADGMKRTYRVYRPGGLPAAPVPLVVVLHGALGDGRQAENSYGWDAEADRGRFLVAYPDGYKRTWNAGPQCCGPAAAQHVDDVGFITSLVSALSREVPVDQNRIYATGISNGGLLDYRLACDTKIFAAIGPDSATMINPCPAPTPISIVHVHGTADQTIPYGGGPGKRDNSGTGAIPVRIDGPPIPDLIATWRATDHCGPPTTATVGAVTTSVAHCPGGRDVELVTVAGAGHQWPGQPGPNAALTRTLRLDPPAPAPDATDVMWRFFAAHPRATGS
jgi:polyhydroxybutyrate depolymerase